MRTAIVSDLHLGLTSGGDVLRDPEVRSLLMERLAGAERVVLLGDVVELRVLPLGMALAAARPFFEELGRALGEAEVILVPGNHDNRFAEPLLDELSLAGRPLELDERAAPAGPLRSVAEWLSPAQLELAYPGVRLREDVWATHGHYIDAHLRLPRAECVAVATLARLGRAVPDSATPPDYERVTRPIYGFGYGVAQVRPAPRASTAAIARAQAGASERAWEVLAGRRDGDRAGRRLGVAAARAGFPLLVKGLNRLLEADFDADVSGEAIFAGGVAAAGEMARRLGVDDGHVIFGHSHRGGPYDGEAEWELPGGGRLHNTGSWVFATIFHHPGEPPSPYWPGTITWLEDDGPPRRERLLMDRSHADLIATVERGKAAALAA